MSFPVAGGSEVVIQWCQAEYQRGLVTFDPATMSWGLPVAGLHRLSAMLPLSAGDPGDTLEGSMQIRAVLTQPSGVAVTTALWIVGLDETATGPVAETAVFSRDFGATAGCRLDLRATSTLSLAGGAVEDTGFVISNDARAQVTLLAAGA